MNSIFHRNLFEPKGCSTVVRSSHLSGGRFTGSRQSGQSAARASHRRQQPPWKACPQGSFTAPSPFSDAKQIAQSPPRILTRRSRLKSPEPALGGWARVWDPLVLRGDPFER